MPIGDYIERWRLGNISKRRRETEGNKVMAIKAPFALSLSIPCLSLEYEDFLPFCSYDVCEALKQVNKWIEYK